MKEGQKPWLGQIPEPQRIIEVSQHELTTDELIAEEKRLAERVLERFRLPGSL